MPLTGRQGRRRRYGLAGLAGTAVAAWAATITLNMANLEDHLWICTLAIASVCTLATFEFGLILMLAAILNGVNERLDKSHQAMARLYREQPPAPPEPGVTPQPRLALRSVGADDARALPNGRRASR